MRKSAGLLPYDLSGGEMMLLLVHPGGPFWKNKDDASWSIAKGEFEDEAPFDAAIREFEEETGIRPEGKFIALEPVKMQSGKVIFAWAFESHADFSNISSNLFEMEWPPKSGKMQLFPEVDRAAWFTVSDALQKINKTQSAFIHQLLTLKKNGTL